MTQGSTSVTYTYDSANQVTRENNGFTNQTVTYTYDSWGNQTEKKIYAYTTATDPGTATQTISYTYGNSTWGDQLTAYNGQTIAYDVMGNPTTYLGKTLTWEGKRLKTVGTASYDYDQNGLRISKSSNGSVTHAYVWNGPQLMAESSGSNLLLFEYDASGRVCAVNFNNTYYYYVRNGQGDIIKLIDNSGAEKVVYTYDTWGKKLTCTGTLASTLGKLNPFRYRGYIYDEETGWYYLRSRYYDPETDRFLSADVMLSTGQGVLGHNCYAYCLNNPGNRSDDFGSESAFISDTLILIILALIASMTGCASNSNVFGIDTTNNGNCYQYATGLPKGIDGGAYYPGCSSTYNDHVFYTTETRLQGAIQNDLDKGWWFPKYTYTVSLLLTCYLQPAYLIIRFLQSLTAFLRIECVSPIDF